MSVCLFVYFGNDTFKILPKDSSDVTKVILENSASYKCKVFKSRKPLKDTDIQDVYLGWSYAIFNICSKFYHAGFPNKGDDATEVFQNEKDLIISCAENQVLACTRNGKFFFYTTKNLKLRTFNLTDQNFDIEDLVHGETQSIILMKNGTIFQINMVGNVSLSVTPLPSPCSIIQVACGKEHTLFLSKDGQVLSFGNGSRGQLGFGTIENVTKPTLLEALDGIKMKSVECGGWHSAAVSSDGDLYIWGWNENGQLGFPCAKLCSKRKLPSNVETVCCLPKVVEFSEEKEIASVSCGTQHTAVLTENAEVWTWGWNGYGQLGHVSDSPELCDKPRRLILRPCFVPKKVKCEFWCTLISGTFSM